jgi:hypothetical protein
MPPTRRASVARPGRGSSTERAPNARRRAPPTADAAAMTSTAAPSSPSPSPVRVAVPGGRARLVSETAEPGPDGGEVVLQLLQRDDGGLLARIGYRRDGRVVRGPASLDPKALRRLLRRASRHPSLAGIAPAGG